MYRIRKFTDNIYTGWHVRTFAKDEVYRSETFAKLRFRYLKKKAELGAYTDSSRVAEKEHISDCATEYVISSAFYNIGIQMQKI